MGDLQNLASTAVELVVTISVATLVWVTVMAGVYQLIREWVHRFHGSLSRPVRDRYARRIEGRQTLPHPPAAGR